MVTLRQDTRGNFSARKRLPDDVREEYGRRYGQRLEAKFFASASKGVSQAKQMFRDWETEVAGRIAAIRAERTGEGIALSTRNKHGHWRANGTTGSSLGTHYETYRHGTSSATIFGTLSETRLAMKSGNAAHKTNCGAKTKNSERRSAQFWPT